MSSKGFIGKMTGRIKKSLILLAAWAAFFSFATLARLSVGFGFDGTLVQSAAAFSKAAAVAPACSSGFWAEVNRSYDLERVKIVPYALAWLFRLMGFRVEVVSPRPEQGSEHLVKDWRYLLAPGRFVLAGSLAGLLDKLKMGRFVLFFSSSAWELSAAREAGVRPLRILRDGGPPPCPEGSGPEPNIAAETLWVPLSQY